MGESPYTRLSSKTRNEADGLERSIDEQALRKETDRARKDAYGACCICLEHTTEKATARPCGHNNFDFLCLLTWAQRNNCCPLCKRTIQAIEYGYGSNDGTKLYELDTIDRFARSHPPPNDQQRSQEPSRPQWGALASPRHFPRQARRSREFRRNISPPLPVSGDMLKRRCRVYEHDLYSLHVGSNALSGFREVTPEMLSHDVQIISKAKIWIRRELQALPLGPENVPRRENVMNQILSILGFVDLKDHKGHAIQLLGDVIGPQHARLFLHELGSWLRSPCTSLEEWDSIVQYPGETRTGRIRRSGERGRRIRSLDVDEEEADVEEICGKRNADIRDLRDQGRRRRQAHGTSPGSGRKPGYDAW